MEDLESARVQMVEKIKSISDFIEREIENENSKKVEEAVSLHVNVLFIVFNCLLLLFIRVKLIVVKGR